MRPEALEEMPKKLNGKAQTVQYGTQQHEERERREVERDELMTAGLKGSRRQGRIAAIKNEEVN
jgi:hypothetical protein